MCRREAINARLQDRKPRTLTETDYLMGVYDGNRMGALRFKFSKEGGFYGQWPVAGHATLGIDPGIGTCQPANRAGKSCWYAGTYVMDQYARRTWFVIGRGKAESQCGGWARTLVDCQVSECRRYERFRGMGDDYGRDGLLMWYRDVRMPGVALRQSAPQFYDWAFWPDWYGSTDILCIGYDVARLYGWCEPYGRSQLPWTGRRIIANCDDTDRNLEQLWRRIVFNIAVSNCDDYLRNYGFLLTPQGWRLSPAYDMNPDEYGIGLKLNISENDNSLDFDLWVSRRILGWSLPVRNQYLQRLSVLFQVGENSLWNTVFPSPSRMLWRERLGINGWIYSRENSNLFESCAFLHTLCWYCGPLLHLCSITSLIYVWILLFNSGIYPVATFVSIVVCYVLGVWFYTSVFVKFANHFFLIS